VKSNSRISRAREVFDQEIAALRAVRDQLDETFDRVVELITSTVPEKGKLVIAGIGKSGNIGQKIAATFNSTGTTAVLLHPVDALHGDLGIINDGDVVVALSYSGETEELVNLLPALKRFACPIVSLTAQPGSSLGRYSDFILKAKVPREACPFNLAPTCSTTAMLALGDAGVGCAGIHEKRLRPASPGRSDRTSAVIEGGGHHASARKSGDRARNRGRKRGITHHDPGKVRELVRGGWKRTAARRFYRW
jgi:D-arabinose 5-phosphate isomerase GutQ